MLFGILSVSLLVLLRAFRMDRLTIRSDVAVSSSPVNAIPASELLRLCAVVNRSVMLIFALMSFASLSAHLIQYRISFWFSFFDLQVTPMLECPLIRSLIINNNKIIGHATSY